MRIRYLLAGLTVVLVGGCTSGNTGGGKVVTVTVPPSTPPAATGSTAGNLSASNTATPTAPSATATSLPGTCGGLLSDYYVQQALGGLTLSGSDAFVVGVPDKTIGRLSTINCRYGVSGSTAKVEIGVSLYGTAAQASARIAATGTEYTANGATSTAVTVDSSPAATGVYLSGGRGEAYRFPLLAVAADRRTVAVTIDPAAVKTPPAQQAATAVAKVAIARTA